MFSSLTFLLTKVNALRFPFHVSFIPPHPLQPRFHLSVGISPLPLPATYSSLSIVYKRSASVPDSAILFSSLARHPFYILLFCAFCSRHWIREARNARRWKKTAANDHSRPYIKHGHNCNATFRIFVLLYMPFSDVSTGFGVRRDPSTVYQGNRLHLFSRYVK